MKIKQYNLFDGSPMNVFIADTFWLKLRGLLFRKPLLDNECMMLEDCNSVHTMFMRYPIDIVFLDDDNCIVKYALNVHGVKMLSSRQAKKTVEFFGGTLPVDLKVKEKLFI